MASQAKLERAEQGRLFFGHPRGLAYLAFAEAWERFSYFGMQSLLVLYTTQHLLLPAVAGRVWGLYGFETLIQAGSGPMTRVAMASAIFGLYTFGVYFTPILGGLLADRLLGRTRAITLGALTMAAGHFMMAFEVAFLPALACLLVGVGLFKGNIATQVGELYAPGDLRRADAFQLFMTGITLSAILSPLACGALGQEVGWRWGFGAAGVGMLIGLLVYLSGRRWLPLDRIAPRATGAERPRLVPGEGKTIAILMALLPALALVCVGNQQMFNAYLLWADANADLHLFGHGFPVTALLSFDAVVATVMMLGSLAFWRWWARRWREPNEIVKLAIGSLIATTAPLILVLAALQQGLDGRKAGLGWIVVYHLLNEIGFANIVPVGLALYSRAAPKAVSGAMIGFFYLAVAAANLAVGWLGGLLDKLPAPAFWLLHSGVMAVGALILLASARLFGRRLAPTVDPEAIA